MHGCWCRVNEEIHQWRCVCVCVFRFVRLNRDRAAELTQPVCPGVGGQQQQQQGKK